ncbi:MAG TPA: DUF3147 family protein [Acidimicrobiia bacterium]|jgi:hypothetical protein
MTGDIAIVLAKGLVGGAFVAAFALIGESVQPKSFAGLFSAAPSIALAALAITLLGDGPSEAREQALAMVFGAVALVVFCILAAATVDPLDAVTGSSIAFVAWFAVAGGSYFLVLR